MTASSEPANTVALHDPPRRRGPGRPFLPGQSGNPSGVSRDIAAGVLEARRLALSHAPHAIERLAELLDDEDGRVVAVAATALLDRAGVRPHSADLPTETAPVVDVEDLRSALAVRVASLAASVLPPPLATPTTNRVPPRDPEPREETGRPLPCAGNQGSEGPSDDAGGI